MSTPGLIAMRELLDAATIEVGQWQQSPSFMNIPAHRVSGFLGKIQALRGCGSVALLRTGLSHVVFSADALGIPVCDLAPSLIRLSALLDQRQRS